jgi:hypothetical protein
MRMRLISCYLSFNEAGSGSQVPRTPGPSEFITFTWAV